MMHESVVHMANCFELNVHHSKIKASLRKGEERKEEDEEEKTIDVGCVERTDVKELCG